MRAMMIFLSEQLMKLVRVTRETIVNAGEATILVFRAGQVVFRSVAARYSLPVSPVLPLS